MSAAPQGQAGAAAQPPADARPWSRQWGLEFVGPSGAVNRDLERRFWATRATWQQTTAAVLSAGAVAGPHRCSTTSGPLWAGMCAPQACCAAPAAAVLAGPLRGFRMPRLSGSSSRQPPLHVPCRRGARARPAGVQAVLPRPDRAGEQPAHIACIALQHSTVPPGPSSPAVERETTRSGRCLAHSSCCLLTPVLAQTPRRLPGLLPFPRRPTQQPPPRYTSCSCGCWLCWRRMPSHACAH